MSKQTRSSWPPYAAALWALTFAAFHILWSTGSTFGLSPSATQLFDDPRFLVYALSVVGLCLLAAALALAMVQPWGRRIPRWLVLTLAALGSALLLLRSGGSLFSSIYFVAEGKFVADRMVFWELWFYLGAVLFILTTWRFWRGAFQRR